VLGRWAWNLFADKDAIAPVPVVSAVTLLAFPAVLVLANAIAAIPARAAGRTKPAEVLRSEQQDRAQPVSRSTVPRVDAGRE
jgi:predicted lysophospholipase L1 biosynthesis ABC-type transport system permease subunit